MCPEDLADALEHLAGPYTWPSESDEERPFGFTHEEGSALLSAYTAALPTLALGYRMWADPTISGWVSDLQGLDSKDREARAQELASGAPRGLGRRVIAEMLLRAAEAGRHWFVQAGAFSAPLDSAPAPHDPQRAPKRGAEHDRLLGVAQTADRIVRALVAYPHGIEPTASKGADQRAAQRLLQEVGARVLRESGPPPSPSRTRRLSVGR